MGSRGTRSTRTSAIGIGAVTPGSGAIGELCVRPHVETAVARRGVAWPANSGARVASAQTTNQRRSSMRRLMMRRRGSQTTTPRTGDVAHSRRRLRLPTSGAALAVSIAALIVAMAGSAYAATTLAKNSVGTKQLQKGAVTSGKIAKGAVTNGKIAKGAVGAGKLKSGLVVPNATHANTADSATNATNATNATT